MPTRELDKLLLSNNNAADGITKRFETELARRYVAAYDEIEAQIAKLFAKMGDTPSLVEAKRYKRLDNLRAAIIAEYRKLTKVAIDGTRNNSASIYARSAYGTQWAYDQAVGVELKWPVLSVEAIRASVWNGDSGENFAERFKNWETKDVITWQNKITQGLALGEPFAKVARSVRDAINSSYNQAIRIVRTEAHRNYSQGHLETYANVERLGIQAKKQWVATLDTRTRDSHGSLDGEYEDDKGLFYANGYSSLGPGLFNVASEDINCRCRLIEVIEGFEPELRRIRGEGIVPYKSYTDWAMAKGWTKEGGWPKEAESVSKAYVKTVSKTGYKAPVGGASIKYTEPVYGQYDADIKARIGRTTKEERTYISKGYDSMARNLRMDRVVASKAYANTNGKSGSISVAAYKKLQEAIVRQREYEKSINYGKGK